VAASEVTPASAGTDRARVAWMLAVVGGFVDAVGFLTLFGLFTAHMSGNTARTGVELGTGDTSLALSRFVPIVAFVAIAAVGFAASHALGRRGKAAFVPLVACEVGLLVLFMLVGTAWRDDGTLTAESVAYYLLAVIVVGAMALQTVALRRIGGVEVHTTFVTGVLATLAEDLVDWHHDRSGDAGHRVALHGGIVALYLGGAIAGAALVDAWDLWCLAIPIVLLIVAVATARPPAPGSHASEGAAPPFSA
jgi:uncharacterized membrane protein YoaK (UPF0700 family)